MSNAVANTTGAVRPVPTLTKEQVLEFIDEPLKQLPVEWRIPVWDFWAFFEHLLPTQIALCTRLRRWHDHDDLTLEETQKAMDDLRRPGVAGGFKFGSEVLASLGEHIENNRERARLYEQTRKLREEVSTRASGIVSNLAEAFRNPAARGGQGVSQ